MYAVHQIHSAPGLIAVQHFGGKVPCLKSLIAVSHIKTFSRNTNSVSHYPLFFGGGALNTLFPIAHFFLEAINTLFPIAHFFGGHLILCFQLPTFLGQGALSTLFPIAHFLGRGGALNTMGDASRFVLYCFLRNLPLLEIWINIRIIL